MTRRIAALALVLCSAASAGAEPQIVPSQSTNSKNQQVSGAANATTVVTLTVPIHTAAHLASVDAWCSAGTGQVTITDGGTQIWSSPPTFVGTTVVAKSWNPGLIGGLGKNMVITLSQCGSPGASGTVAIQADIF